MGHDICGTALAARRPPIPHCYKMIARPHHFLTGSQISILAGLREGHCRDLCRSGQECPVRLKITSGVEAALYLKARNNDLEASVQREHDASENLICPDGKVADAHQVFLVGKQQPDFTLSVVRNVRR
jgi:hypothetical protein